MYTPKPIDTRSIVLPSELNDLQERLARHVHDVWATARLAEGWTYGPERDDQEKTHPGLVAFDDLSEEEKKYDRATALETLKAVIAAGWRIQPAGGRATTED
ncbi:Ryanodine receptor Ryr [Ectothiorhodospiraceae bacterium WFHF3C12]|nr:Ryanodine receptor Ryr [Ectothiorhodospiraceae bacterium WFHF3C12]